MLIQAPYAVECFEENTVVLPMTVLEELDNMKKEEGEKGANVRKVIRILDAHREKGNLLEGVRMEWGGILRVEKITGTLNCLRIFRNINLIIAF